MMNSLTIKTINNLQRGVLKDFSTAIPIRLFCCSWLFDLNAKLSSSGCFLGVSLHSTGMTVCNKIMMRFGHVII